MSCCKRPWRPSSGSLCPILEKRKLSVLSKNASSHFLPKENSMRDQTIIAAFQQLQNRQDQMDNQVISLSHVLKEIVGKELMRAQALHKVLMDKGLFTDEDLKKALEDMVAEAKADLEKQAQAVKETKEK